MLYVLGSGAVIGPSTLLPLACAAEVVMPDTGVDVTVTTDKPQYASGDAIVLHLEVTNRTDEPVVLRFSDGQRFDLVIRDEAGEMAWRWSADKAFIQVLGEEQLAPGESLTYEERFEGSLQVGTYTVLGMLVASNEPLEASTTFAVSEE